MNHPQKLPVASESEPTTEKYSPCNLFRRQNFICKAANETCIQLPREECDPSNTGCVNLADEPGICIGYVQISTHYLARFIDADGMNRTCHSFLGRSCASGLQCLGDRLEDGRGDWIIFNVGYRLGNYKDSRL